MVPGIPQRVPRGATPGSGLPRRMSRLRPSPRPRARWRARSWGVVAAVTAALVLTVASQAAARQGNPPPDERRPSADRHAERRAALERQRRGEASPVDGRVGAWRGNGYGAARTWPDARFGFGWNAGRGFWCVAYPEERGRRSGGRGFSAWGCGPVYFPYVAPGERLETPYDWPWGWPYVPRHRFDGRYPDDAAGQRAVAGSGVWRWAPTPVSAPGWPAAPTWWYRWEPIPAEDCAYVVIRVVYGGTFSGWVQPSRFGAEDLRDVELAIDALLSEGYSLLLMTPDGFPVRVPAGLPIDTIRVAQCSMVSRP